MTGVKMFVFQVVDIMRVNVDKVLERDQKISELDDRAGNIIAYFYFTRQFCIVIRFSLVTLLTVIKNAATRCSYLIKYQNLT